MGINLNQPYSPSNNGTPTVDPQVLAEEYGFAYGFLNSVPELKNLFNEAVANGYTSQRFQAALQGTTWFRTNSQAAREAQTLKAVDPTTYKQQLEQAQADIQSQANSMGATLSSQTVQTIAQLQVSNGWNTNQIAQALSKYVVEANRGGFGGLAGQNQMNMDAYATERGVSIDPQTMKNFLQNIADNKSTIEDFQGFIRQISASKYPAFSKEIEAGVPLAELAAPYQNTAQKILETGPESTQLTNPLIQAGLNYTPAEAKPGMPPQAMSLVDYQNFLRSQPQWKQTQNAQNATMQTAKQVLTDMGLGF